MIATIPKSTNTDEPAGAPLLSGQTNDRARERRQLTVLFCDLVGSTAISASLDPEDESTVLREYHRRCAERITDAGGFVAQFQGDGVIGYFGYEQASESDAERAVRAALELVNSSSKIVTVPGVTIEVRIGVATGLVIVGDPDRGGTRLEQAVVGDTINLAARLQSIANANEVIIAESTRRLIGNLFACRNLGSLSLKGYAESVPTWQVLRARTATSQFKSYREPILTKIVGRDAEVDVLLEAWRRTVAGHGQIVDIVGEAGIGKSRLIQEFRRRIGKDKHIWLEGGGSQFFQYVPFHAISQMIRRALDPFSRASQDEFRARLMHALTDVGMGLNQSFPLIAELLGLPTDAQLAPLVLSPGDKRDRLFAVLIDWLCAKASRDTMVLVIEDLHWVDPSSLELIRKISKRSLPVLILVSMRTGFRAPTYQNLVRIRLKKLPDEALRQIIDKVSANGHALPDDAIGRLLKRAGGVPLFAVELARLVMELKASGADRRIPATLSDLLTARLDQLGPAKAIAQVAAVIGDEVPLTLLRMVSGLEETRLQTDLARLLETGLLQQTGSEADPTFSFKHSLLRDAAYEALLKTHRRQLHHRTALLLSERFGTLSAARPEVLADHWAQAGESHRAIATWQQAGETSKTKRAYTEAQQAYQAALSILLTLTDSSDRDAQELALQCSLAEVLCITCGYSASQTISTTTRARELSQKNGNVSQQFVLAVGTWAAASSGGEYVTARHLADQVFELALANSSRVSLAHAHMIQMTSRYRVGDLVGAEDYFERGDNLFKSPDFEGHPGWVAQTYGNAARNIWIMGDEVRAQQRIDHALNSAARNNCPYDAAFAHYMAAIHSVLTDNIKEAVQLSETAIHLSDKHGFPQFAAISRIALGRAVAGTGAPFDGISLIRDGLAGMAGTGSRVAGTLYMTWLAEAELLGGRLDNALHSIEKALELNPQEMFFRPASLHLRGDLLARSGFPAMAIRDFRQAMHLSTKMGAKRFYDRAAGSLRRLLLQG